MSHQEQRDFCRRMRATYPRLFQNALVLDIGSRDLNGNNREFFTGGKYVGVDAVPGPNVDHVCKAHELDFPADSLDFIITTEVLEHDPFRALSLARMVDMLKTGGHLLVTCATTGRPVHGEDEWSGDGHYYENVSSEMLLRELGPRMHPLNIEVLNEPSQDLYYFGRKV